MGLNRLIGTEKHLQFWCFSFTWLRSGSKLFQCKNKPNWALPAGQKKQPVIFSEFWKTLSPRDFLKMDSSLDSSKFLIFFKFRFDPTYWADPFNFKLYWTIKSQFLTTLIHFVLRWDQESQNMLIAQMMKYA